MDISDAVLVPAIVFVAVVAVIWVGARQLSSGSKSKRSIGGFAWAMLFLSGGRMPPPPPQSQIEQETVERKNREISRGGN